METCVRKPFCRRMPSCVRGGLVLIAVAALSIFFLQSACSKKSKAQVVAPSEVRIVLLPLNTPAGDQDLRWTAMLGPIVMGKVAQRARDLKVVPFWESMPTAIDAAGVTRTFTQETASSAAAWLSAKWSCMGDITRTKTGVRMMIEFMPAKTGTVPFRFTKSGKMDEVGAKLPDALSQFAYYLTIRPLESAQKKLPPVSSLKKLAEALDLEYGWFVEANPGKAQAVVSELAGSDPELARFLFNPSLYPALKAK
ncbi:MAG: hypothetical protein H6Q04_2085 [Acidobacteria bacterium]|nr:hypothetical protein [Acidobacteriota bacterium]